MLDLFGLGIPDVKKNKQPLFVPVALSPSILPAKTPGPPPLAKEPNHSSTQCGAGQLAGREEMTRMMRTIEWQERMIENLTEQQTMLTRRMMRQETNEDKGIKSNVVIKNGLVAGPAPIRIQKMSASDDPEAYLHTLSLIHI